MLAIIMVIVDGQTLIIGVGDLVKFKIGNNPVENGEVVEIFPSGLMFVRIALQVTIWNNGSPKKTGFDVPIKPENIILP